MGRHRPVRADPGGPFLAGANPSTCLSWYKAKDLLRASRLGLLPPDNIHVRKDLEKVANGKHLSPVLVVRGRADKGVSLTVADGYHRICASHHLDENADVPCRLVAWP